MYIVWFSDGTRFRLYCEECNQLEEAKKLLDSHNRYYKKDAKIALVELEPVEFIPIPRITLKLM